MKPGIRDKVLQAAQPIDHDDGEGESVVVGTGPNAANSTIESLGVRLGLTIDEQARALAVPLATLQEGAQGPLPQEALVRLAAVERIAHRLAATFEVDYVPTWVGSRSRYLGGQTPKALLFQGEFGRVEAAIEAIDSGVFL